MIVRTVQIYCSIQQHAWKQQQRDQTSRSDLIHSKHCRYEDQQRLLDMMSENNASLYIKTTPVLMGEIRKTTESRSIARTRPGPFPKSGNRSWNTNWHWRNVRLHQTWPEMLARRKRRAFAELFTQEILRFNLIDLTTKERLDAWTRYKYLNGMWVKIESTNKGWRGYWETDLIMNAIEMILAYRSMNILQENTGHK